MSELKDISSTIAEITERCRKEKIAALPVSVVDCLNKGYISIIDFMGTDHDIAESARTSYMKGTNKSSNDPNLISRLIRNEHTTPIEQITVRFEMKAPIFVIIQLLRHRTATYSTLNSESARYSELADEFFIPEESRLQAQSKTDKQGSGDSLEGSAAKNILDLMLLDQKRTYTNYQYYLHEGLARELARINIPVSTYMTLVWKIDLHNLFNLLRLRMDHHAQFEFRVYADAIYKMLYPVYPTAFKYFDEHILYAQKISRTEFGIIKDIVKDYLRLVDGEFYLKDLAEDRGLKSTRLNDFLNLFKEENV